MKKLEIMVLAGLSLALIGCSGIKNVTNSKKSQGKSHYYRRYLYKPEQHMYPQDQPIKQVYPK